MFDPQHRHRPRFSRRWMFVTGSIFLVFTLFTILFNGRRLFVEILTRYDVGIVDRVDLRSTSTIRNESSSLVVLPAVKTGRSRRRSGAPSIKILITGVLGNVGYHFRRSLLEQQSSNNVRNIFSSFTIFGIDNFNNDLYSSDVKRQRWNELLQTRVTKENDDNKVNNDDSGTTSTNTLNFVEGDICDVELMNQMIIEERVNVIVHLASQRYTRDDGAVKRPFTYPFDNIDCFVTILDTLLQIKEEPESIRPNKTPDEQEVINLVPRLIYLSEDNSGSSNTGIEERKMTKKKKNKKEKELHLLEPSSDVTTHEKRIAHSFYQLYNITSVSVRVPQNTPARITYRNSTGTPSDNDAPLDDFVSLSKPNNQRDEDVDHTRLDDVVHKLKELLANSSMATMDVNDRKSSTSSTPRYVQHSPTPKPTHKKDDSRQICFITSMFAPTIDDADEIRNISNYTNLYPKESRLRYFFFTNLNDLAVDAGWERIVIPNFPYHRMITASRWPKFMAWNYDYLLRDVGCRVMVYSDANLPPQNIPYKKWRDLTNVALFDSPSSGLYQRQNKRINVKLNLTVLGELDTIMKDHKDLKENVEKQKEWLVSQPDFNNSVIGYWNMILVYDPYHEGLRNLMTTFWTHYSREHQSWRDQPLYRYLVSKLSIFPKIGTGFNDFFHTHRTGKNRKNHRYTSKDNNNNIEVKFSAKSDNDKDSEATIGRQKGQGDKANR